MLKAVVSAAGWAVIAILWLLLPLALLVGFVWATYGKLTGQTLVYRMRLLAVRDYFRRRWLEASLRQREDGDGKAEKAQ